MGIDRESFEHMDHTPPPESLTRMKQRVLGSMRRFGYAIDTTVDVTVDPDLGFMGYTTPMGGGFRITVSGRALRSGMLEGLLVHELSHVYRMTSGHPSHDGAAITASLSSLPPRSRSLPYQQEMLHDIINNIEDLYADGIAFRIMRENRVLTNEQFGEFLQGWVTEEVGSGKDGRHSRWLAAHAMLNNARAIAQMRRHGLDEALVVATERNARLLGRLPSDVSAEYPYFLRVLTNLPEETSLRNFQELLTDYLSHFVRISEGSTR